ncbi:hypothetical protein BC828DRAFT_99884 [Blastocladiella britannica]|nr:hypothetical protein BC828DRAFT_99884 [Blastocladiella britannica]
MTNQYRMIARPDHHGVENKQQASTDQGQDQAGIQDQVSGRRCKRAYRTGSRVGSGAVGGVGMSGNSWNVKKSIGNIGSERWNWKMGYRNGSGNPAWISYYWIKKMVMEGLAEISTRKPDWFDIGIRMEGLGHEKSMQSKSFSDFHGRPAWNSISKTGFSGQPCGWLFLDKDKGRRLSRSFNPTAPLCSRVPREKKIGSKDQAHPLLALLNIQPPPANNF